MKTLVSYVWKTLVCAVAYVLGSALGIWLATAMHVGLPSAPPGIQPAQLALFALLASLTLGASLGPLASALRSRYLTRFAALALFTYVCLGVNTALETTIFTSVGGTAGMIIMFFPSTLACAAAAAALFRSTAPPEPAATLSSRFRAQFGASSWAWRLAAAIVAFPLVYLAFGLMVEPFVIDAYRNDAYGLTVPGWGQIIPIQFLRGTLFLIASLPAIALWGESRLRLALSLGLANYVLVGLFGLLQAFWLPTAMRLAHGTEVAADSFAYAALLVLLLVRRTPAADPRPLAEARRTAV